MKTRAINIYQIMNKSKGFSERYFKSAIPYMQRLLKMNMKKQLKDLRMLKRDSLSQTNFACDMDILMR